MKRLLLLLVILIACNKPENNTSSTETIPQDSVKVIEQFFQSRHNQMKSYYDSLIYKFTPTVLSQEQLMRMTESPTLYKMYKYFDNNLNENMSKHGEIIMEFHNKTKGQKDIPKTLIGKYIKLEKFYYDQFYKVAEKYKKWIYERKVNLSKQA